MTERFCYIGRKACECVASVTTDNGDAYTGRCVAEAIAAGETIERVPWVRYEEIAREETFLNCPHGQMKLSLIAAELQHCGHPRSAIVSSDEGTHLLRDVRSRRHRRRPALGGQRSKEVRRKDLNPDPTTDGVMPEPPYTISGVKKKRYGYVPMAEFDLVQCRLAAAEARAGAAREEFDKLYRAWEQLDTACSDTGANVKNTPEQNANHIRQLATDNQRLREALEAVEYVPDYHDKDFPGVWRCLWCKGERWLHRPDCQRQAALQGSKEQ